MLRVEDSELDISYDMIVRWKGNPFTGVSYEQGPGAALTEIEYKNGIQHGITKEWSSSGRPVMEAQYEHGICITEKVWNEDGELVRDFQIDESHPSYKRWLFYKNS
jgi:antitoxin component YwqK of YwqJK toxin-antitoxin module